MARRRLAAGVVAGAMLMGAAAGISGCASPNARDASPPAAVVRPEPPVLDEKARLSLDSLGPLPGLPPASQPAQIEIPDAAARHYRTGLALARSYQSTDALAEFEAALRIEPNYFEARRELGRTALQTGMFPRAQEALAAAAQLQPRDWQVHYLLGLSAYLRQDDTAAIRDLRQALALAGGDSERIRPLFYLARVLERQGYCQAAIEAAGQFETLRAAGAEVDPFDPHWQEILASQTWRIAAIRGECLRRLGRPGEAVQAYELALQQAEGRSEILLALAETLIDTGNTRRAIELADQVLEKDPRNSSALAILSATLAVEGRMDELENRLVGLVRQDPSDALFAQRVSLVFQKFGLYGPAFEVLLVAYDNADESAGLHGPLLQAVFANADFEAAVEQLARLLAKMPSSEQASLLSLREGVRAKARLSGDRAAEAALVKAGEDRHHLLALAVLAEAAGRPVPAERALRRLLAARPDDVPVAVLLAERLVDQRRWQEVLDFVKPLAEKHPDVGAFHRLLGAAYDGLDDLKAAMTSLYEALRRDKRDYQAMWLAAQINDRLGQVQPATSIYQALVTVKPDYWPAQLALVRNYLVLGQARLARQHAAKLKESYAGVPAVELATLMVETGQPIPPAERVAALTKRLGEDPVLLRALAEAHLQEGRSGEALDPLNRLLAERPDDEEGRLLLTTALTRRMEYDLAQEVLQALQAERPNRRIWRFAEAELLIHAGRPAEAVTVLEQLAAAPWDPEQKHVLLARLIFALEYAGRYDQAIQRLQDELARSPKDRTLQTLLLGALEAAGRHDPALEQLAAWRRAEPNDPLLQRLQIQMLVEGDAHEAAAAAVLEDWPDRPAVNEDDGEVIRAGQAPQAARDEQARRRHERNVLLLATTLGRPEAAVWLANRAWLGQSDLSAAGLADAAAALGKPLHAAETAQLMPGRDDAEELARRAQWLFLAGQRARAELLLAPQLRQKDPELHARLKRMTSTFYKRMSLDRLSVQAALDVYRSNTDPARAGEYANDLAYVWAESDTNLVEAEDLARLAVASDPASAAYLDTLGWVYYKQGRFEEALGYLQRAVAIPGEGEDPVLYDHLGDTLWRLDRRGQALVTWRKAEELYRQELQSDPTRPDLRDGLPAVQAKIRSVESHKLPAVAAAAGAARRKM